MADKYPCVACGALVGDPSQYDEHKDDCEFVAQWREEDTSEQAIRADERAKIAAELRQEAYSFEGDMNRHPASIALLLHRIADKYQYKKPADERGEHTEGEDAEAGGGGLRASQGEEGML